MSEDRIDRRAALLAVALVLIPVVFNAVALLPELRPIPRINDESWHYVFIQRANAAISGGANPFDPWIPELECGFPYFTYYQHLPHLAVVALSRLTFGHVSLIEMFCVVRYLLLVGFPLTVYWSMRTMEFSIPASATGAAFSSLIAAPHVMGFEYESYLWNGWGLYTQLWAMHLLFIVTACFQRLLIRGVGVASAVVAFAILVVSHPFYAGIAVLMAIVLVAVDSLEATPWLNRIVRLRSGSFRLALAGATAALITAYFWIPFALGIANFRLVALPGMINRSAGPGPDAWVLTLRGQLLDNGRLPILVLLVALGIASAIVSRRRTTSRIAVATFLFWTVLYLLVPEVLGRISGQLPGGKRFIAPAQMSAIFLIGIAGEQIWSLASRFGRTSQPIVTGAVLVALMIPAVRERYGVYSVDAEKISRFSNLSEDTNWRDIVATLKSMPPGRTYFKLSEQRVAGLVTVSRVLLYDDIETLQSASGLSLNAGLQLMFDDQNPSDYDTFNIRYVIALPRFEIPPFLTLVKANSSFALYRADTTGYARFVKLEDVEISGRFRQAQESILREQQTWLMSDEPWRAVYRRWIARSLGLDRPSEEVKEFPSDAAVLDENVRAGRFVFHVDCKAPSNLVIKSTYNPNWRVTVDGRDQPMFAVSPYFLGVLVPAGKHEIVAEYRSTLLKKFLMALGVLVTGCVLIFRRRLDALTTLSAGTGLNQSLRSP
ncbi:MAG TPA: YfhO family protein [Candidatus Binataceae bacterium]|nr:YfhO family protein [Candidatus Binataceae bacterium]